MKYRFTVPPTEEQGSHAGVCSGSRHESYRKNALWDYNSARAHDGLPPLARMPAGTHYAPILEHAVQMHTAEGWEDVHTETTRRAALASLAEYRKNAPGSYRLKTRAEE